MKAKVELFVDYSDKYVIRYRRSGLLPWSTLTKACIFNDTASCSNTRDHPYLTSNFDEAAEVARRIANEDGYLASWLAAEDAEWASHLEKAEAFTRGHRRTAVFGD